MKQWSWEDQELVRLQQVEVEYKALKERIATAIRLASEGWWLTQQDLQELVGDK